MLDLVPFRVICLLFFVVDVFHVCQFLIDFTCNDNEEEADNSERD